MHKRYSTPLKDVKFTLNELLKNMESETSLPIKTFIPVRRQDGSSLKQYNEKYQIRIGTKNLYKDIQNGCVTDSAFVDTIWSCFHEEKHLQQFESFQKSNPNHITRHFAHVNMIRRTFPESYLSNTTYWENAMEIDAELYGILRTQTFFKTYRPDIDIDDILVNLIQQKDHWYAPNHNHIQTIDEAIQRLDTAIDESYTKPLRLNLKYGNLSFFSKQLRKFASNPDRKQAYIDAYAEGKGDGTVTTNMLLDFIREEYPWKYKNYPCLEDEWDDRIRTSEKSFLAHMRGLDRHSQRVAELEAQFGNMMPSENTEKDDKQFGN